MRRLGPIVALWALVGAFSTTSVSAASGPMGRLVVEVSNGTTNGTSVVGDRVTVQLYRDRIPTDSLEADVGENGEAVFDNLPTGQSLMAVARAKHQNMAFASRPVTLTGRTDNFTARVQVFDVSDDQSQLSVGTHHIIISMHAQSLEFTEYVQLRNMSDMAVTGSQRDAQNRPMVVEIGLPKGFKNLRASDYFEQNALVTTETGFYDTMAAPPGEHHVTFSYQLPINRTSMSITKRISLPTSELVIFWKTGQGKLEGLGEPDGRLVDVQGVPMEYYSRDNVAAGDEINFQVSGLNVAASDTRMWIILGVVFAVVAVIAVVRLRSSSTPPGPQT